MMPSGVSKIVSFFSPFTDESVEIGNEVEARGQSCSADAAGKLRTLAWMFFGIDRSEQHQDLPSVDDCEKLDVGSRWHCGSSEAGVFDETR